MNRMKSGLRTAVILVLGLGVVGLTVVPALAFAASKYEPIPVTVLFSGGYWGGANQPLIPCTGIQSITQYNNSEPGSTATHEESINKSQTTLPNGTQIPPCESLCDIFEALQRILYFALTILMYVLVPVMVFIGGFLMLISGGNPSQRATGTKTITSAVIGLAIAFGAFLIVNTFLWLVFSSNDTTSYTYTGDALSGENRTENGTVITTKATRVTWPNISCDPSKEGNFKPTDDKNANAEFCRLSCLRGTPSRNSTFDPNAPQGKSKCTCTTARDTCEPACNTAKQICQVQSDKSYKCVDKPSTPTPTPTPGDDSKCDARKGVCQTTACTNGGFEPGLCSGGANRKCCVPNATPSQTPTPSPANSESCGTEVRGAECKINGCPLGWEPARGYCAYAYAACCKLE